MKMSDGMKVSLVTAVCALALAVIPRYFLGVQLDFVSQYGPVWIFIVYVMSRGTSGKSKACRSPLFWSLAMIFATLAILAVYAL
jgi:hypothetical protein